VSSEVVNVAVCCRAAGGDESSKGVWPVLLGDVDSKGRELVRCKEWVLVLVAAADEGDANGEDGVPERDDE